MADVKVRVEVADCGIYPDVQVTCAESDRTDRLVKRSPVLVVEVLSDSTASYDWATSSPPTSNSTACANTCWWIRIGFASRFTGGGTDSGGWTVRSGGRLRLDSIALDCPVETLYEDLSESLVPSTSPV